MKAQQTDMSTTDQNIQTNRAHYDQRYQSVDVNQIARKVRKLHTYLQRRKERDTSWHGLYHGNFEDRLRGTRVFEVGCGDGLNALIMASLGAEIVANDISTESERIINQAADVLELENITAVSGDFAEIQLEEGTFDFVVGKAFLHHLTEELEDRYMRRFAKLLKPDGEARFFEPAQNSKLLDTLRWMTPVPGRPSSLARQSFERWKQNDPHPDRDNSSSHYRHVGEKYFEETQIVFLGSLERLCRLMPHGRFRNRYRQWAHREEVRLPLWFRDKAARAQTIVYRRPLRNA